MEDEDDGDSDEHGEDWVKKASVQELEERAEKAADDQANEYEKAGLDDDSDWKKEGKEDYVPGGGGGGVLIATVKSSRSSIPSR